jgi:hypothetical protein
MLDLDRRFGHERGARKKNVRQQNSKQNDVLSLLPHILCLMGKALSQAEIHRYHVWFHRYRYESLGTHPMNSQFLPLSGPVSPVGQKLLLICSIPIYGWALRILLCYYRKPDNSLIPHFTIAVV